MTTGYHHGNLRTVILDRARAIIAQRGVDALSLRAVSTEVGVSHAAPRHHFASRQALLTAIAAQGFTDLAEAIEQAQGSDKSFLSTGLAYLRFALDQPAAFEVMFTPTLLDRDDPELVAASARALGHLQAGAADAGSDADATALAAWSLIHGFAQLARSGSLAHAGYAPDGTTTEGFLRLAGRAASLLRGGGATP